MIETWLRDRPSGTTLEPIEVEVRLGKNETIHRERALAKSLVEKRSDIASWPFPVGYAKRRLREVVDQRLAIPDIAPLVRFDRDPVFPPRHLRVDGIGSDKPALGMLHTDDAIGMLLRACRDAVIEKLDALIDAADTRGALGPVERKRAESELSVELAQVHMRLGALIWQGKEQNLPVEFDPQMSALSVLQCELRTLPKPLPGTSPEHVVERIGAH